MELPKRRHGIMNGIFFLALPVFFIALYFHFIYAMMAKGHSPSPELMMKLQCLCTFILLISIALVCFLCGYVVVKLRLPDVVKNVALLVSVLIVLLLGAECFFLHYERSDAVGFRWSYKLWCKKYLTHLTPFNYTTLNGQSARADFREPALGLIHSGKKKSIWFIGDSFTFGFGLEQTSQTFPALVQKQLADSVISVNLGNGGADTYQERETLFAFEREAKQQPYAVVWQYFGNDIDSADNAVDIYQSSISGNARIKFGEQFFRGKSFLLDFVYWKYFRNNQTTSLNNYVNILNGLYHADSIVVNGKPLKDSTGYYVTPFKQHLKPLKQAGAHYKAQGTKFLVIIFPYLWQGGPENAEDLYAKRLANELNTDSTDVINLTPLVKNIPVEKRMANSHDPHPSVLVDKIVADTIAKYFVSKYGI